MFTKWYKVIGITKEMYEANKHEFAPELVIWIDGDKVEARIRLNVFEAFRLRQEMKAWNKDSTYKMYLVECKEEKLFKREENVEVEAL